MTWGHPPDVGLPRSADPPTVSGACAAAWCGSARRREALIAQALWAEFLSWIDEQSDAVEADAWLRHAQQHAVGVRRPS